MNINFFRPDISEIEIAEVTEAMRSGWITTGPRTKKLEMLVKEFTCSDGCVCFNSQTSAAEMALRLLGIGKGDEVITAAYTYTASASVVCHVDASLVLVDSATDSFEMDYDKLEAAITEKTKVIIPVDIGGVPCDYDRIFEIVERKKHLFKPSNDIQRAFGRVIVLADTAHALGAVRKGVMAGSVADFSAFSFHAVKNFTTAEGGALTWKCAGEITSEDIYSRLQLLSLHGQNKSALDKSKSGSWEYDIIGTWYKCNMTDIAAAMGIGQMKRYPEMLEKRHSIIKKYDEAFKDLGIYSMPHEAALYKSSGHLYITRVPGINEHKRNEIIIKMGEMGVICNVHYKPLPMHTAYKKLGFDIKNYPKAYSFYENEISLPLYTLLTEEETDYVINAYKSVLGEYLK